jgi:hypothetical protein
MVLLLVSAGAHRARATVLMEHSSEQLIAELPIDSMGIKRPGRPLLPSHRRNQKAYVLRDGDKLRRDGSQREICLRLRTRRDAAARGTIRNGTADAVENQEDLVLMLMGAPRE